MNNISLNNVYCVSAGCDDFLVELCFVCDLKSDLKNILFRNGRYDQDTGVIDFALSEVSKYVPEVQVVANIVCSQQSSSFKEPIFQKCLEDCISAFLLHIRQQAINYKKMESLGDLTANPVKVAVPKNTIDLTGDDLEDEKWDPYFLDITNENEDDFYDYVCSEADTGFSDDTISKFRRRSRSFCDVEKWLEKMDLTKQPAGFNFEYEEVRFYFVVNERENQSHIHFRRIFVINSATRLT